jgi:hypothetical protein
MVNSNTKSNILHNPMAIFLIILILMFISVIIYRVGGFVDPATYIKNMANLSRMSQSAPISQLPFPLPAEVYNISDQKYTYQQAKCKCGSYGSRLATINDLSNAYNDGAEWCNYGWTDGGYVVFPTQQATYNKLKKAINRGRIENGMLPLVNPYTKCGRAGLNGGLANKNSKFGVNCYGMKPPGGIIQKSTVPIDKCELEENEENVESTDNISIFNSDKWSHYN